MSEDVAGGLNDEDLEDVGPWSIRKNEIVSYYASIYADITRHATARFKRFYIDGFSNRGRSRLRGTEDVVLGSALRALNISTPFDQYIFVEQSHDRMRALQRNVGDRPNVSFVEGDSNIVLLDKVFPSISYDRYERALCFLDPYNLAGLRWETIAAAGANQAIEAIIHFPTMDAHRTVLPNDPGSMRPTMKAKMTAYWGNESWMEGAYTSDGMLPMQGLSPRKRETEAIIRAFQDRLRDGAGFKFISKGFPMRNTKGNTIYHLIFASHNSTAQKVMQALERRFTES